MFCSCTFPCSTFDAPIFYAQWGVTNFPRCFCFKFPSVVFKALRKKNRVYICFDWLCVLCGGKKIFFTFLYFINCGHRKKLLVRRTSRQRSLIQRRSTFCFVHIECLNEPFGTEGVVELNIPRRYDEEAAKANCFKPIICSLSWEKHSVAMTNHNVKEEGIALTKTLRYTKMSKILKFKFFFPLHWFVSLRICFSDPNSYRAHYITY